MIVDGPGWLFFSLIGSEVWRWLGFALTIVLMLVLRKLVKIPLFRKLRKWSQNSDTAVDRQLIDAVDPPLNVLWWILTIYLALRWLDWPASWAEGTDIAFRIACIVAFAWALFRAAELFRMGVTTLTSRTQTEFDDRLVPFFVQMFKVVVVIVAFVITLQEFGFNAAAIIGALGVGSLAVALAAENMFANWFGALMLYTDQPFTEGDWIKTTDVEGIVESVGMRSTELRTFSKTVVSVPNSRMASGAIENFSRMPKRRVYYTLTVDLEASPDMLDQAVKAIEKVLDEHEGVDSDEFVVRFSEIVEQGYDILILYWTNTTSFDQYIDIKHQVHIQILKALEELGVRPAVPRVRYENAPSVEPEGSNE
jgi:MscS family membrane protein